MPVQTFSVPQGNCPAGQKTVSASAVINNNPQSIFIRLTSSEWDAKAGLGTLRWGVERSPDGSVWQEWIFQNALNDVPMPIGTRGGKDGLLPAMAISGGAMVTMVGWRVRLFAVVAGVDILLGAEVAVTT
jgi:hypothetical protein